MSLQLPPIRRRKKSRSTFIVLFAALACASFSCARGGPDGPTESGEIDANILPPPPPPPDDGGDGTAPDAMSDPMPCDVYDQTGCTGLLVCDLDFGNLDVGGTACRGVKDPGTELDACDSANDCAGGYSCFGGQCYEYCESNADCQSPGGVCFYIVPDSNGDPAPGAPQLCTKDCDPEKDTDNRCPSGFACHPYTYDADNDGTTDGQLTDCDPEPASGGGTGQLCGSHSDCRAGFGCIQVTRTDSEGNETVTDECRHFCRRGNDGDCPGSQTCFDGTIYSVGDQDYSACL